MLDTLRQPEYTGENRCLPCTVVNGLIAVALAGGVAGGVVLSGAAGVPVGAAGGGLVLALSFALIYLRGYLVPGTPALTKRYLPPWVLRLFGKDPTPSGSGVEPMPESGSGRGGSGERDAGDDGAGAESIDAERFLLEADALEPCQDRDDLCLTESFRAAWNEEMARVREAGVDAEAVVAKLGLDVAECTITEHGEGRVLRAGRAAGGAERDGRSDGAAGTMVVGKWPSEAALIADSAAATVLSGHVDEWGELGPEPKGQVLSGVRLFLTDCPTGEGGVEFGQETVESCCSSHEVVAVTCTETGDRLFEQPIPE